MGKVCIPLICGFPTKVHQDGPEEGRMCPRCHNASVVGARSRTWFEFFWIPLIPLSGNERIFVCGICNWEMKQGDGPDPQPPSAYPRGWNPYDNRPPPPNQARPPPPHQASGH